MSKNSKYIYVIGQDNSYVSVIEGCPPGEFKVETDSLVTNRAVINISSTGFDPIRYSTYCENFFIVDTNNLDSRETVSYSLFSYGNH